MGAVVFFGIIGILKAKILEVVFTKSAQKIWASFNCDLREGGLIFPNGFRRCDSPVTDSLYFGKNRNKGTYHQNEKPKTKAVNGLFFHEEFLLTNVSTSFI